MIMFAKVVDDTYSKVIALIKMVTGWVI